ncbi:MAG: hypothetical protein ACP5L4_06975 [Thermoplasmata archaeon]|jgi:UTP:GlnB (protein PII) uridylyltransferase
MPKSPYVKTYQINLRLPEGLYEEMMKIMNIEKKWNSPQQFIQDALNEKIERWKKEHPGHP